MSTEAPAELQQHVAEAVLRMARVMYPHDALPDEVYARVGTKLAEAAADDAETGRTITDGVAALDDGGDGAFAERSADQQLEAVKAIERSPFFELVRSTAVVEVYSDPATWKAFGYEGASFDQGGYVNRGFNDLDWLPDPDPRPADAAKEG
ncbi:MAG: hypothetical protein QOD55_2680 [Solirubrobacteraceae bacterium]|jgi:hypothetical protein|nr:hypothetical protein [Solirubrobacteraceae bacterium]